MARLVESRFELFKEELFTASTENVSCYADSIKEIPADATPKEWQVQLPAVCSVLDLCLKRAAYDDPHSTSPQSLQSLRLYREVLRVGVDPCLDDGHSAYDLSSVNRATRSSQVIRIDLALKNMTFMSLRLILMSLNLTRFPAVQRKRCPWCRTRPLELELQDWQLPPRKPPRQWH